MHLRKKPAKMLRFPEKKPTPEIRRAEHRAHMLHGKCSDTWPGRQEVSRQQTPKWVPKPSTARAPTGWATSKTFHTLGILGDIPRQTTECQKIPNRSMELKRPTVMLKLFQRSLIFSSSTEDNNDGRVYFKRLAQIWKHWGWFQIEQSLIRFFTWKTKRLHEGLSSFC